jgi:membrane-associated phospholipid phosphatase
MPLLVLIVAAFVAGSLAAYAVRRAHLHLAEAPALAAIETRRRPRVRAAVVHHLSGGRLDAAEATSLALFAAFIVTVAGAFVVGILSIVVRSSAGDLRLDASVADWGQDEATAWSTDVIRAITHLGDTRTVAIAATVLAVVAVWRSRDRDRLWTPLFLAIVIVGNNALFNVIKELFDRARPAFDQSTAALGPSFPSGHSATAAAGYAAMAFVLARRSSVSGRACCAGVAVGIAVAVAVSRVMLGVHWVTDTVCGLALGWAWCAVVVVAFGGRLLRFGATAEAIESAARDAELTSAAEPASRR